MQLSALIGKQILTRSGERLGYVKGARFDKSYCRLTALEGVNEGEEEFFLPLRAVLSFGDALIARDMRVSSPTGISSPVGIPAFTPQGESLGVIGDVLFDGKEGVLILVNDGVRTSVPALCALINSGAIVYPSPEARPKRRKKPVSPAQKQEIAPAEQQDLPVKEIVPPQREEPFRCNLLGKRVKKPVYDSEGVLIAEAGEHVSPEILSLARRKNRLLALAVNTLTNLP